MCGDFAVFFFQGALDRRCGGPEDGPFDRLLPPYGGRFCAGDAFPSKSQVPGGGRDPSSSRISSSAYQAPPASRIRVSSAPEARRQRYPR